VCSSVLRHVLKLHNHPHVLTLHNNPQLTQKSNMSPMQSLARCPLSSTGHTSRAAARQRVITSAHKAATPRSTASITAAGLAAVALLLSPHAGASQVPPHLPPFPAPCPDSSVTGSLCAGACAASPPAPCTRHITPHAVLQAPLPPRSCMHPQEEVLLMCTRPLNMWSPAV
jgi:hypothetical protein